MLHRLLILVAIITAIGGYCTLARVKPHAKTDFQLQKIAADGVPIPIWSGPWSCVLDRRHGLLWEVKTDAEFLHDGDWTYSWFDGQHGVENAGDCFFEPQRCDTQDLIRRVNEAGLCGRNDWRLPTPNELMTLVDSRVPPGYTQIDKNFFPHTRSGDYWSSANGLPLAGVFEHLKEGAAAVNFGDGRQKTLPFRNAAFLRLVTEVEESRSTASLPLNDGE
ncbi:DUF1566 domain-containing protein [Microbulbifer aggregans]|uniref:Lcl C-terminal domain-containing protein n=1 Tax=Microbulbifer aggregans TaxID=1769779 RepID=UPI001CFF3D6C|nr:DUF1566 domain-containing protein [Microbulbifer aggregans]